MERADGTGRLSGGQRAGVGSEDLAGGRTRRDHGGALGAMQWTTTAVKHLFPLAHRPKMSLHVPSLCGHWGVGTDSAWDASRQTEREGVDTFIGLKKKKQKASRRHTRQRATREKSGANGMYVSLGTAGGTDGHPRNLFAATGGMGPT